MAKLLIKPSTSTIKDAGLQTVASLGGYAGYDLAKKHLPINKEIELAVCGGTLLAQSAISSKNTLGQILQLALLGVALNAGISSLENYGVLPSNSNEQDQLNGLAEWQDAEYIAEEVELPAVEEDIIEFADPVFDLSGADDNADLI